MTPAEYKACRLVLGYTQGQLATLMGVSRETIVRREGGRKGITSEAVIAIMSLGPENKSPHAKK